MDYPNYATAAAPKTAPQTEQNNLIGKSVAGYQSWFKCGETLDGGWHHWSGGSAPAPGHMSFELFPDVSEYPEEVMADTRFDPMPDGRPTRLFRSRTKEAIDIHFGWMRQYGVDGVAVQRFYGDATGRNADGELLRNVEHLKLIRDAAERNDRIFYMMYDVSGAGERLGMEALEGLRWDMVENLEGEGIVSSPAYAHADGKPVLCIWGLNGKEPKRYPGAAVMVPFVKWLKERGYFVIGGVSDNGWTRDESEYAEVYRLVDMISPWTVGRYGPPSVEDWQSVHIPEDMAFCREHGKVYQPVMFPGFAWSIWNGGPANHIARQAGEFLWKQARLYAEAGIRNGYFAMFDEYDEGTAIMKAAEDSESIPTGGQYFQTLSADGQWLSSDFYLRLAGRISRMLRGEAPVTERVTIPYSEGPVYWRTGFEKRVAGISANRNSPKLPMLTPVDLCCEDAAVLDSHRAEVIAAAVVESEPGELCYRGRFGYGFCGLVQRDGWMNFRLAETKIAVTEKLTLRYARRPGDENGRFVGVDLLFDDGKKLSELVPEQVLSEHGTVDEWETVRLTLGEETVGRSIMAVLLSTRQPGHFTAFFDDIAIEAAE